MKDVLLQLNGHDRFKRRAGDYFTIVQRYEHHSGADNDGTAGNVGSRVANIHMYSFALKPEEHQPSGTCNFSRIDNAVLNFTLNSQANATGAAADQTSEIKVYAVNSMYLEL